MELVLTGSIAYDYLMTFPGRFRDHILPDRLDSLSLSFLVDSLIRRRGGIAANIAYTLALLGEQPKVMAAVGEDFDEYRSWLDQHGVDTSAIRVIPGMLTASFFVTTDEVNSQFASFYTGAMARAAELRITDLAQTPDLVMVSPNDPNAMMTYVEECIDGDIPYLFDPSQQIVRLDPDDLKDGIEQARAVFVNDYEWGLIQTKTGLSIEHVLRTAEFVLITRGEDGALLYEDLSPQTIPVVPPEQIVDPTGVGDAFRAGFLKGYLHGVPLACCAQMGALAATLCLENNGPQGHHTNLAQFLDRFREVYGDRAELDRLL